MNYIQTYLLFKDPAQATHTIFNSVYLNIPVIKSLPCRPLMIQYMFISTVTHLTVLRMFLLNCDRPVNYFEENGQAPVDI